MKGRQDSKKVWFRIKLHFVLPAQMYKSFTGITYGWGCGRHRRL